MPSFDTYSCDHCSEDFKAFPDAEAAQNGYCSPSCQTTGKGLN